MDGCISEECYAGVWIIRMCMIEEKFKLSKIESVKDKIKDLEN